MSTKVEDDFLSLILLHFNLLQLLVQQACLHTCSSLDGHLATILTNIGEKIINSMVIQMT